MTPAEQVDLDLVTKRSLLADIRCHQTDTGVGHNDVKGAELGHAVDDHPSQGSGVANIRLNGDDAPAEVLHLGDGQGQVLG